MSTLGHIVLVYDMARNTRKGGWGRLPGWGAETGPSACLLRLVYVHSHNNLAARSSITDMRTGLLCWSLIALSTSAFAAVPSPTGETRREVRFAGPPMSGPVTLEVLADPALCPGVAPREQKIAVPGSAAVDVSGCSSWDLTCSGKAFCSFSLSAPIAEDRPMTVDVYPAADVRGQISVPRQHAVPRRILVSGRMRDDSPGAAVDFALESEVDEEAGISFNVPAGAIDLRIAAEDLAPTYRWNVRPEAGVIDLGRLEMVPGGSLLGYVVDADTGLPVDGARITAVAAGFENLPVDDKNARTSIPEPPARSNERGSFQLTSLSPRAYRLRVEHPDYLTVEPAEVSIVRNAETILGGDVLLSKPLRLRLQIDPPRSPYGHRWEVTLADLATSADLGSTKADVDGVAEFDRLAPADLRLRVEAKGVSAAFTKLIELTADHELTVEIPFVEIFGSITMNDEPVHGEVDIETGAGDRWESTLDEDGRFQLWVREPRLDFVFLTVRGEDFSNPAFVRIEDVIIEKGKIELEVELLDLEISGVVTNQRGTPIRGAVVVVERIDQIVAQVQSEADGSFVMRPLQPGAYRVSASLERAGTSQREIITLGEAMPAFETRLVIRPSRNLEGLVRGPSGEAVGGAKIVALSGDQDFVSDTQRSDINGRFVVKVAPDSRQAVLIVAAQGYPYWSSCVPSTQELSLQLPSSGGQLETKIDHGDPPEPLIGQPLIINSNGGVLPFNEVFRWSWQHGGGEGTDETGEPVFRVPNISTGRWAMMWTTATLSEIIARSCNATLSQELDWVTVTNGETARLLLNRGN